MDIEQKDIAFGPEYGELLRGGLREVLEAPAGEGRVFAPVKRLEEYINDYELHNPEEQELAEQAGEITINETRIPTDPLEPVECEVPIAAVDASVAVLGETDVGVIAAFKCAVVYLGVNKQPEVYRYIAHFTESNRDVYVKLRRLLSTSALASPVKPPTCSLDRMPYRIMNLIERIAQRHASTQIRGGIVLWDGSMTRTKETGIDVYKGSINLAARHGNYIVAISKRTRLRLATGEKITTLLDAERRACVAEVHDYMPDSIKRDLMGRVYAVKFAADGFTFRVDVAPATKGKCKEVLKRLAGATSFVHGYPDPLARAHIYSYFTRTEITALQAYALERYSLRPVDAFDIRVHILGPFG